MTHHSLFIASTGQHVGKTTTCLGIFSGLQKRLKKIAYMKPIGQEHVEVKKGLNVDKDVVLFKEHFQLKSDYQEMSPVLIPSGFTRDYLDGKIDPRLLIEKIDHAAASLKKSHDFTLYEGTGHCGVGSIIDLNNAQVASRLKAPLVLVAAGGLGSSYDALMLNKALCDQYQVNIVGVILNQVLPDKKEMIDHYMRKALSYWKIPILGSVPFDPLLSYPSMKDFASLFKTSLQTGQNHQTRHCAQIRLVATSVEAYRDSIMPNEMIITPANREDIILATVSKYWEMKISTDHDELKTAFILTGDFAPRHYIIEELRKADIPMLYTPFHSHTAMRMISSFTAKIQTEDLEKVEEAVHVVEQHIDFDELLARASSQSK